MIGTLYFIQSKHGGPIKIGYTAGDPKSRLQAMQTASPERLKIIGSCPGSREAEKEIHSALDEHRLVGEWFKDCTSVRAAMEMAINGEVAKPRARRLPCGCVPGYFFCADADDAWRAVGLARARQDAEAYIVAIRRFGDHVAPRESVDELLRAEGRAA